MKRYINARVNKLFKQEIAEKSLKTWIIRK